MLIKNLVVEVGAKSWGRRPLPSWLNGGSTKHRIHVPKALLMLGTLTLPSMISPASPARFWGWLRYFLSIADQDDLKITRDFSELDPHQKSILSDDFGVAISTQWMFDRLGGFQDIVDGRQFMLQFPDLLVTKKKAPTAKVGPSKAPDYVVLDRAGRWHVLECKGTQSGPASRDKFLRDALSQKQVIQIGGAIRGERLAAGLSISHEHQRQGSDLKVIDPEVDPILTLGSSQASEMKSKIHRLSVARALGMVGLSDSALELSLPANALKASEYLHPAERRRVRATAQDRVTRASSQLRSRELRHLTFHSQEYEGREVEIALPDLGGAGAFNVLKIRQGVNSEMLEELSSVSSLFGDVMTERIDSRLSSSVVTIESDEVRTVISHGEVLFSEVVFKRS